VKKKVLHIITRMDMGGSAQNTLLTCCKLSGKYDMTLIHGLSHESEMTEIEKKTVADSIGDAIAAGVKVIPLSSMIRNIHPGQDLRALLSLVRLILKERPSIVHTHSSKGGILGRLAAKLCGVPHVVHTPHGHVFYGHFGALRSKLFLWIEKVFSSITDRTVALTRGEKNDYIDMAVCPAEKLLTIHSGVDLQKFSPACEKKLQKKRALRLSAQATIIGFVGWLLPIKGPHCLLDAMEHIWSEHADASLVLVGKGDLEDELRHEVLRKHAAEKVRFLGWRPDIHEIMPLFDMLVLPSRNEGMGRVLVEAMAAGKPVIASDTGGIPDLVKHGVNGLLFPPGDEMKLAEHIEYLISNPGVAKQMGKVGRQMCRHFSLESMIRKLDRMYEDLLGGSEFSPKRSRRAKINSSGPPMVDAG
jgi:glycosyltransferase involved in cell wall biosynthesis